MPHVAIILHPQDDLEQGRYFLLHLRRAWEDRGVRVQEVRDPHARADADLAVLHVDLTVIPPEYAALGARYPRCVNGRLLDISKRAISRQLVTPGDGYQGPVIVKTNMNCGGVKERALRGRPALATRAARWLRGGAWAVKEVISTHRYEVFDHVFDVPPAVWSNPALVVERFLAERDGDANILRTWVFFGDRFTHFKWWSHKRVIKIASCFKRENAGEVPEELWQRRRELGVDFAKIDYGLVDGKVVLYDVNRTPTVGNAPIEDLRPRINHLQAGLESMLAG